MTDEEKKRCDYCGTTHPDAGFREVKISKRARNQFTGRQYIAETPHNVCAGTACGANLQMAHEG